MNSNSSVNVNFKVTGGEVQSYMDRLSQRALEITRQMIRSATEQNNLAKDQLKSFQQQIAALERKLTKENELAKVQAQINRDERLGALREDIGRRYNQLDQDRQNGAITNKQYRQQIQSLDNEEKVKTIDIEDLYQQELNSAKEEKRDNAILLRTLRENVDTIKSTSQQEVSQMRKGDDSLVNAIQDDEDPNALLANRVASEQFLQEQNKQNKEQVRNQESTFSALLKTAAITKVGGMIGSIPQAENELDYIKPMTSLVGMLAGGLVGNLADLVIGSQIFGVGLGQTSFGGLGAELGEKFGEFAGSALERTYKNRDQLTASNFRLQALLGRDIGVDNIRQGGLGGTGKSQYTQDLSMYGATYKDVAELQYRIATAQGTGKNLGGNTENLLALQQGVGVGSDLFSSLSELLRTSKESNRDVMKLVGGVLSAGQSNIFSEDSAFLPEFLSKNFSELHRTLLSTQNQVATGTTFDILRRFDSVGGPFGSRDPRSQGLINTINNSLVNPGSDNLKALSFIGLRQANPEMDFYQLMEERQKGLASPVYLRSMLQMVERIGGPESMKMFNLAGALGLEGNLSAVRQLYQNQDKFLSGEWNLEDLTGSGRFSQEAIRTRGRSQTSTYSAQGTAQIDNAFNDGAVEGIKVVGERMKVLFGDMMTEVQEYIIEMVSQQVRKVKNETPTSVSSIKNKVQSGKVDMTIDSLYGN